MGLLAGRACFRGNRVLKIFPYLWPEDASVFFWGRHIWCRIFRPIDWYHSLVPQFFCRVIWDLGHFFVPLFGPWLENGSFLGYCSDFLVLFFSISYRTAYWPFCFGPFMKKLLAHQLFPFSSEFYAVRRRFVLKKIVDTPWRRIFCVIMADWETDAEMAEGEEGTGYCYAKGNINCNMRELR